ncbi:SRSF protein kinase 1-like [Centruroides sculpturatus]|uniref:SRSF protein kinase 1-like n=1 Tax=Centruroides sculpturatus TaxID=218467 RepID=UPI000C6E6CEA|nr:SRSF protein kinase 1-like [Centruroides sculpturatus]
MKMSSDRNKRYLAKKGKKKNGFKNKNEKFIARESESISNEEIFSSSEDEQEDQRDYCKGGYCPVKIGDVLNSQYRIIRKLGWGHFSTVWLCWDSKEKRFVALKLVKSASHFTESAADEIKLLRSVRDTDLDDPCRERVIQLLDNFQVSSINGNHTCMVFEVLGHNLLKLIIRSNYQGIPIQCVKTIISQVLEGLHYLHTKCNIIHTDIKPENVLITVDESYIKKLTYEVIQRQKLGLRPLASQVCNAPRELKNCNNSNMSKNKKKKLKKKANWQQKLIEMEVQELEKSETDENIHIELCPGINIEKSCSKE